MNIHNGVSGRLNLSSSFCFSVYSGHQSIVIPPLEIESNPALWLSALSQYKGEQTIYCFIYCFHVCCWTIYCLIYCFNVCCGTIYCLIYCFNVCCRTIYCLIYCFNVCCWTIYCFNVCCGTIYWLIYCLYV